MARKDDVDCLFHEFADLCEQSLAKNSVDMATSASQLDLRDRFAGVLLGTAVGDALGLAGGRNFAGSNPTDVARSVAASFPVWPWHGER